MYQTTCFSIPAYISIHVHTCTHKPGYVKHCLPLGHVPCVSCVYTLTSQKTGEWAWGVNEVWLLPLWLSCCYFPNLTSCVDARRTDKQADVQHCLHSQQASTAVAATMTKYICVCLCLVLAKASPTTWPASCKMLYSYTAATTSTIFFFFSFFFLALFTQVLVHSFILSFRLSFFHSFIASWVRHLCTVDHKINTRPFYFLHKHMGNYMGICRVIFLCANMQCKYLCKFLSVCAYSHEPVHIYI